MKITKMKLSDMKKPDRNVRYHTEQQLREFERSVRMFGQIRPIVVDENNLILAGNGLYETLLNMGEKEAEVYKYTNLTENQKKKLMIADNKIFALGIENLDTLNAFIEELKDDLDIPGYDSDILRQMTAEAEDITEKISQYGVLGQEEIDAIKTRSEKAERKAEDQDGEDEADDEPVISDRILEGKDEETAEIRKFVLCPKCGEKIWL